MGSIELNPQSTKCLICGSDKLRRFRASAFDSDSGDWVNIVECESCVFGWQYPLGRTDEQSIRFFEDAYENGGRAVSSYFNAGEKRAIAEIELDYVAALPVSGRNLLDIGAGAGIFAKVAAENDWTVTALDPAIDPASLSGVAGVNAIKGSTSQIPNGETFDVVTLWDVIEHVSNPVDMIQDAKKYVKEGGWLVVETGNHRSAARVGGGAGHWIYQLDHRWYFTPESLKRLLADAGFSTFIFADRVLRPDWNGAVGYAGPSRARLIESVVKDPLRLPSHLWTYHRLTQAKAWELAGIDIFAVAARMPSNGS